MSCVKSRKGCLPHSVCRISVTPLDHSASAVRRQTVSRVHGEGQAMLRLFSVVCKHAPDGVSLSRKEECLIGLSQHNFDSHFMRFTLHQSEPKSATGDFVSRMSVTLFWGVLECIIGCLCTNDGVDVWSEAGTRPAHVPVVPRSTVSAANGIAAIWL